MSQICSQITPENLRLLRIGEATRARRQDSVTGGAEIKFVGAREVYLCEFEKGTGAREIYSSVDQTKKLKTKKKVFSTKISTNSGYRLKIPTIFHEFLSEDQKKGLRPKCFMKSGCESTKITKIRAVNANLGVLRVELHSSSLEPVNFFGAQSSLGGAQAVIWGALPLNALPWRWA